MGNTILVFENVNSLNIEVLKTMASTKNLKVKKFIVNKEEVVIKFANDRDLNKFKKTLPSPILPSREM